MIQWEFHNAFTFSGLLFTVSQRAQEISNITFGIRHVIPRSSTILDNT